jgi:hypothetical protein
VAAAAPREAVADVVPQAAGLVADHQEGLAAARRTEGLVVTPGGGNLEPPPPHTVQLEGTGRPPRLPEAHTQHRRKERRLHHLDPQHRRKERRLHSPDPQPVSHPERWPPASPGSQPGYSNTE